MMINEAIRVIRRAKGMTQAAIAQKIGIRQSYYNLIENGKAPIMEEKLTLIANALNVTVSYIKSYKLDDGGVEDNLKSDKNPHNNILLQKIELLENENKQLKEKINTFDSIKIEFFPLDNLYPVNEIKRQIMLIKSGSNWNPMMEIFTYSEPYFEKEAYLLLSLFIKFANRYAFEIYKEGTPNKHKAVWYNESIKTKEKNLKKLYDTNLKRYYLDAIEAHYFKFYERLQMFSTENLFEKFKIIYDEEYFISEMTEFLDIFYPAPEEN